MRRAIEIVRQVERMIKILIIAIVIIVIAAVYSLCIMRSRDDRRRERDARSWTRINRKDG